MKRTERIKGIQNTIETFSDEQLELFIKKLKEFLKSEDYRTLGSPTPQIGWGRDTSTYEDKYNWMNDNK